MWLPHLLVLLAIYAFGPGLLLVRRLRLAPAERFVVSIGVGLFVTYLLSFAIFALKLPPVAHVATTVACVVLGGLALRDWAAVLRSHQVRRLIWGWLCLLLWGGILLSMIRHYGGGTWGGDWLEHVQRSNFFSESGQPDFDPAFKFIDQYPLPMRPPMMNAITASLLAQTADPADPSANVYERFQFAFLFLNSLVFLPLALVIPRLVKLTPALARKAPWTLAAVLAASPMFSQNLTYAWTKLFAAFYAVLAIAVYLRAMQRAEGRRRRAEQSDIGLSSSALRPLPSALFALPFALLCAGFLVHFSVGPYALFLGLHYLLAVWRRRPNKLAEAAAIGGVSLAVLATWFVWSVATYGAKTTFTSTSAVSDAVVMTPGENVANIAKNLGNTLLPTIVRDPGQLWSEDLAQQGRPGQVRDFFFLVYQVSLPGGLGLVGCALAIWLLARVLTGRAPTARPVRRFWLALVPVVYVVGSAVYGGVDRFGVAHICLQPLVLLGLCLVAGGVWTLPARARGVLLVGLLLDFALGVFLQANLQHHLFAVDPITAAGPDGGSVVVGYQVPQGPDVPSRAAQFNLKTKIVRGLAFWGDRFAGALPALQFALGCLLAFLLFKGLTGPRWRRAAAARPATAAPARPARQRPPRRRGRG